MAKPVQTSISDEVLISLRRLIRAIDLHSRYLSKHFGQLKDWEQSMILSSLQRLVQMVDAKDINAEPVLVSGPLDVVPENAE